MPKEDDEGEQQNGESSADAVELVNDIYRVLKSNKVLGQVLRNKFGNLSRRKIEEIIEVICDGGLRCVNSMLADDDEIARLASAIKKAHPDYKVKRLENLLRLLSFVWTVSCIREITNAINVPEINGAVGEVVERRRSPALEIVGYINRLQTAEQLTEDIRDELNWMLAKHKDPFVRSVVSLATQQYINTHRSERNIEQSVCSLLGIRYRYSRPGM